MLNRCERNEIKFCLHEKRTQYWLKPGIIEFILSKDNKMGEKEEGEKNLVKLGKHNASIIIWETFNFSN